MACANPVDMKKINAEEWDLSTKKRVHHSTIGTPEGPSKGARALPETPVPGKDGRRSSELSGSATSSPQPTWSAGVEGETVQYKKSRGRDDVEQVHHAVKRTIEELFSENQNISFKELRDKAKDALKRELNKAEIALIQELTSKEFSTEAEDSVDGGQDKAARQKMLKQLAEDSDDEENKKVGVPKSEWDADAKNCFFCGTEFSMLTMTARHHCRGCGRNTCDSCSKGTAVLPADCGYGKTAQRICNECSSLLKYQQLQQRRQ